LFQLHPRLDADTLAITDLDLSKLYLMNDSRYVWLILVPQIDRMVELHDLDADEYSRVMEEVRQVSEKLAKNFKPAKINVGALGNMVPQLHIHIIAREKEDDAWPGPVWGVGTATPYTPDKKDNTIQKLTDIFKIQ
jgi:diadenosine tetraphosphate (Ap4A) HIT family hydrolase